MTANDRVCRRFYFQYTPRILCRADRPEGAGGSIPAVAIVSVFANDYLGQVVVPLLTFPETSIATEARASG